MSANIALTKPEFQGLLVDPEFVGRVSEAMGYTVASGYEAGFAVYRNAGGLALSEVLLAEDFPDRLGSAYGIDMTSVTEIGEDIPRPDLVADLHMHASEGWRSLRHSGTDLKTHCNTDKFTPGYVSVVGTPDPNASDITHLAFARTFVGMEGHAMSDFIEHVGDVGPSEARVLCDRAGINVANVNYTSLIRGIITPEAVADSLFRAAPQESLR